MLHRLRLSGHRQAPFRQAEPVTSLSLLERTILESGLPTLMFPAAWLDARNFCTHGLSKL